MIPGRVRNFLRAVSVGSFAVILLCSAGAHAQAFFQPLGGSGSQSQTLPTGSMPLGVAVADFNHDGYPDLVVGNKTANTISVYLSTGTGGFQAPVTYPTCGGPTAALAEDLDLTGLPDIVITCNTPTSNVIEVFLNLGNGTFNPVVDGVTNIVLGTGLGPVAITSGDFNRDGHPDLAVADSGDGTVTLFLSNPAVNFTYYTVKTLTGLGTPTAITTGIFGQFGHMSLAVTDSANNVVHILNNNGNGGFTAMPDVPTQAGPDAIVSGDFNHDGFTDLAVVNSNSGTVSILFGKNNNTFQPSTPISIGPATGTGSQSILALDVNGDGYQDLLIGNPLQNQFVLLLNNRDGTFQPAENYAVPNGPTYLATGDFNRDGKPDLAVTQSTGATVSLLINNTLSTPVHGSLNFVTPHTLINGHGNMADGVAVADFNHDGYPDIAASYFEDNSVRVLPGIGGGNFISPVAYPVGKQPYSVAAGDLNNDGFADLVTANTGDNTISVLMNSGSSNGRFFAAQSYPVGRLPYQVAIGDLNGDGIPDLAVSNYGDNTVSILYGQVGGGFIGGQTLATCTNPYGVAIGDTRNTGQNDIAVTCFQGAQMEVFLNNSMLPFMPPPAQASFQSPVIYTTDLNPTSVVMGDFNRDGNLDIVTGNSTANDVSFFSGRGDGSFKIAVNSFALNFPSSIAAGDVNGDGIPDLVTVAANFNQVAVLLGKGDGTFLQRVEFASGQQPWAVALADFNRDGKLDIVTANTVNRVNLTIPAYQTMYMNEFPPTPQGGPSLNVLLNGSGTTITLTYSPTGTVTPGTPVTFTATVSPTLARSTTTPTGTVTFEDSDGTVLGSGPVTLSGGTASLTVPNLGSGNHQITVLYSGDVLYQPNTETGAAFVVAVSGTPVSLTFQPNPVTFGSSYDYTAIVGTAGSAAAPVGTATLFTQLPNGTLVQSDGPYAVIPNGNGTSTSSGSLSAGTLGTSFSYVVFNPTSGTYTIGSSPTVAVTVMAGP